MKITLQSILIFVISFIIISLSVHVLGGKLIPEPKAIILIRIISSVLLTRATIKTHKLWKNQDQQ